MLAGDRVMKVGIFYTPKQAAEHKMALDAMYQGARKFNDSFIQDNYEYNACDVAVTWSIFKRHIPKTIFRKRIHNKQKELGKKSIILEKGYIARNIYYSAGYNSQNGWADFKNKNMPGDRWSRLSTPIKDYRSNGEHILLCGQVPWDTAVQHINYKKWCEEVVSEIQKYSDRPIIFRPHPLAKKAIPEINGTILTTADTIKEDFKNCWATVAFNSNSSVESVLEGIPSFVCDEGSMAWDVSNKDFSLLENPGVFQRKQWAYNLAYSQWTLGEMMNGETWGHLNEITG